VRAADHDALKQTPALGAGSLVGLVLFKDDDDEVLGLSSEAESQAFLKREFPGVDSVHAHGVCTPCHIRHGMTQHVSSSFGTKDTCVRERGGACIVVAA
jgi:hypothetical protein